MKKQQESLKNMVYQAILNGIFTDEYKPNQIPRHFRQEQSHRLPPELSYCFLYPYYLLLP